MTGLLVIVPSRGRPQNIARLIGAPGWDGADLLVAVDDDDPTLPGYEDLPVDLVVAPRLGLGATLNKLAVAEAAAYETVGFMGDDHLPRTPGWAWTITDTLRAMGRGIVYGNDLMQGPNLPIAVFMTADIILGLGYMCPPGCRHLFLDNAWKAIGERLGCLRYLPTVVIEHCHPQAEKAAWDDGYAEVNGAPMWEADEAAYRAWLAGPFESDIERVRRGAPALH